jgi:hypothetical protein
VRRTIPILALSAATACAAAPARADPLWGGADVTVSGFQWRPTGDPRPGWRQGLSLAWGPTAADDEGAWRFTALTQFEASMFDSRSYAVGLVSNAFEAAWRLGPFEPESRVGFVLASVDDFDGQCSAQLLSPRAEIGVGVRVGRVRVSLGVQGEYFWRWWGPSVLERGLVLDLRYEKPWRPRGRQ